MVELGGAAALAGGAGGAALLVAPLSGVAPLLLTGGAAAIGGVAGWAIVRVTPDRASPRTLPPFPVEPLAAILDEQPLDELLLDEPIAPEFPNRVVQLFGVPSAETPGAMQARIAAHLGGGTSAPIPPPTGSPPGRSPTPWSDARAIPDASDALHAALDEIRRSLRVG